MKNVVASLGNGSTDGCSTNREVCETNQQVVVVAARRTPCGRLPGPLTDVDEVTMLSTLFRYIAQTARGIPIDLALTGCAFPVERDNLCRKAVLAAGLDPATQAATVSKTCASSDEAFAMGCQAILCGHARTVLVGGVEKNSNSPHVLGVMKRKVRDSLRGRLPGYDEVVDHLQENDMAYIAEHIARTAHMDREQLDEYALDSRERVHAARVSGAFHEEIVPIACPEKDSYTLFSQDDVTELPILPETVRQAPPLFLRDGLHTQYSAAAMADGAAALLLMEVHTARRHGLQPLAVVEELAAAGVPAARMGRAMTAAVAQLLHVVRLSAAAIDLYALNDAFAAPLLDTVASLGLRQEQVNIEGSNLALGYPIGATGLRMMTSLLAALMRRGARYGISAMNAGGYMAQAVLFRNVTVDG